MARKSVTKSKPVTKIRKYQTGSIYQQQVANPYYISGTYAEQAELEAQKAAEAAKKFGNYSKAQAIEEEARKKERKKQEEQAVNETNQQIADQNSQEFQQTATESLTSGLDLLKKYKDAKAIKDAGLIANAAMQAGTAGTWAPIAATPSAASAGLNAGLITTGLASTPVTAAVPTLTTNAAGAITGVSNVLPAASNITAGTNLVGGAVEVGSQVGSQAANAGSALGTGASIGTGLATAGVGLGLNLLGSAIEKGGDDNDFRTFDKKQATSNVIGEATKGAGFGASLGGIFGLPGALIGGAGGLVVGGVKGLIENRKNKKIAKEYEQEQDRINKENEEYERKRQEAIRQQEQLIASSAQKAFTGSRLQGLNTGFGYATSTNMNTQPTSSFYGKTGGKMYDLGGYRVPGGQVVPIGDDAVEFIGNQHSEKKIDGVSGIRLDAKTEVENKETMKKNMKMANGGESDYFFSSDHKAMPVKGGKFLGYTGKSYADIHKAIERSNKPDYVKDIESRMLAKDQEATAYKRGEKDRGPEQIARYGGIHRYQTAGSKEEGETVKSPESWEDIERVLPVPKEVNAKYLENVLSYCEQFPESQNCWNMPHVKGKDGETYIDVERYKKLPYVNQLVGALSSPAFRPGPNGEKIDLMEEIGSPMRLVSRTYRNDIDESVYDVSAKSGNYTTKNPQGFEGMGNPGDRVEIMTPQKAAEQGAQVSMPTEEDKARNKRMKNFDKNYGPSTWVKSKKKGGVRKYQTGNVREEEALLGNEVELQGDAMGTWGTPVVREDLSGVKPSDNVVVVEEEQGVPAGQVVYKKGRKYITPGYINTINGIRGRKEELEGLEDGIYKQRYFTKTAEADGASPFNRYEEGEIERRAQINGYNPYLEGTPDYIRVQKVLDERNRVNAEAAKSAKTYEDLSGTKPPVTAEESANAQSNANASNVTVRDQNQANAQAPSAQTSVAPGGTTNNAGQAAADAAAKSGTQDSTATTTSTSGTPATPTKERLFGKDDATKGGKGVSKSMEKVPEGQGDQGIYFGNVSNAQFDAFKANNPWFDFSAGFDPKKRDFVSAKGVRGSSDVARFQEEYNKHVGQGNKLQVDGKLGEQTATAMLMFTDPNAPVAPAEDKSKKEEPGPTKTTTPEDFSETAEVRKGIDGALIAGLGQLIPVGMVIGNRYKEDSKLPRMQYAGNVGAGSVRGAIMPRVNMNYERRAAEDNTVAIKNAIQNTNAGPGAIAAMMAANTALGKQMLAIANQEQEANKQLAAEEARMGQQASQFNVSKGLEAGMANVRNKLAVDQANLEAGIQEVRMRNAEKQYGREERFGAYDAAAERFAGIYRDKRAYDAQERLAKAMDNTGSYERFTIYEQLKKQSKNKNSPYYGRSDKDLKRIARNTYLKSLDDLDAETAKVESNEKKLGGARKYTSRLGELSKRKKSFNI